MFKFNSIVGIYDILIDNECRDYFDLDKSLMLMKYTDSNALSESINFRDMYRIMLGKVDVPKDSKFLGYKVYEWMQK